MRLSEQFSKNPIGSPQRVSNLRVSFFRVSQGFDFRAHFCPPWFKPGKTLIKLQKNRFQIFNISHHHTNYAILSFQPCSKEYKSLSLGCNHSSHTTCLDLRMNAAAQPRPDNPRSGQTATRFI